MADESLFSIQDAYALAEARAVDVFCIKLYKIGGLSVARKISRSADASGIQINCGGLAVASQFEAAASAQFLRQRAREKNLRRCRVRVRPQYHRARPAFGRQ